MSQLGQTLTDLTNYNNHLNDPVISDVGHNGQYSSLLNPPTKVSTFQNDANYAIRGEPVSEFANNARYTVQGSNNSQFVNDSNYAIRGEGVSEFANDVGYVTAAGVAAPLNASLSGSNVTTSYQGVGVQQTNIGLASINSGLGGNGTKFSVNHFLPAANGNQTYIGMAQAYCFGSSMDAGVLTTIYFCNNTYFVVNLQQQNGNGNASSHTASDILISWQMSLVNLPYSNANLLPTSNAAPANSTYRQSVA